jgi:hypothetical protein
MLSSPFSAITSERKLVEELRMHLAWRWFTGLGFDQEIPHHSTFSKNRHGRFQESKQIVSAHFCADRVPTWAQMFIAESLGYPITGREIRQAGQRCAGLVDSEDPRALLGGIG